MSERPPLAPLWPKWTQIDLHWHRYDQSGPRLTSAGFAMTKVVPDWPPLASLWPKWSQIDLCWLRYDQSSPRKSPTRSGSDTFEMKSTLSGWSLFVCSLFMSFLTCRRNVCLSGKVALASGRLTLFSTSVSACSRWGAEEMDCLGVAVPVPLRLIKNSLQSLWQLVEYKKRVSLSPTLWVRFSLLSW